MSIITLENKKNKNFKIIIKTSDGMILSITNPMLVDLPFQVGQKIQPSQNKIQTYAFVEGYEVKIVS